MLLKLCSKTVFLLVLIQISTGYRILIVNPTASFSHQRAFIVVTKALAAHGHEITFLTTDPFETTNPNIKQISLRFLYKDMGQMIQTVAVQELTLRQMFAFFKPKMLEMMEEVFTNDAVQKLLTDETQNFDAVLVEQTGNPLMHAFADKYNAPLIGITTLEMFHWAHRSMGNPTHPVLHPLTITNYHPEDPNIFQRMKLIYNQYDYECLLEEMLEALVPVVQKFFPENKRSISELMYDRFEFAIECVSPAQGFVRPILPNTKQIGFIHIEPPNPLPQDLQHYLDSSGRGVVYVSFGSNVKSVNLGHDLMNILKSTMGSLPFDVLWKYENNSMPNKPSNVHTITWSPQLDLLAHPKIKLFVTQGGFQSMEESIARGVPVVCIPFFGDQEFNAKHIEKLGIGKKLFKRDLTVERLRKTIMEVIENPSYKKRSIEIGKQVRDTPMNATETAVWHIEHVIRNRGADMFKYKGKSMSIFEYYFLDIIGLVLAGLFVIILVIYKISRVLKSKFIKLKKQ